MIAGTSPSPSSLGLRSTMPSPRPSRPAPRKNCLTTPKGRPGSALTPSRVEQPRSSRVPRPPLGEQGRDLGAGGRGRGLEVGRGDGFRRVGRGGDGRVVEGRQRGLRDLGRGGGRR